jgi:hypothetical protein
VLSNVPPGIGGSRHVSVSTELFAVPDLGRWLWRYAIA